MPASPIARAWLLSRIDRRYTRAIAGLLAGLAEDLSLATADAVTIRRLSPDGRSLHHVAAYHPDREMRAAMAGVMDRTAQAVDSGLWRPIIAERRIIRWHIRDGSAPAEASPSQRQYLSRYPVRAVMGGPVITTDGRLLGGISLVRFVVDRPFTDGDEVLLADAARRAALALEFDERIAALDGSRPPAWPQGA